MSASGQPVAFTIVLSSSEYSTTLDTALLLPGLVPTRHAAQHCVKWLCGAKAAAASSLAVMLDNPLTETTVASLEKTRVNCGIYLSERRGALLNICLLTHFLALSALNCGLHIRSWSVAVIAFLPCKGLELNYFIGR